MDEILTIREIADRLKMAERTIYAMATSGELPAFKLRGRWRMRRPDFEHWLEEVAVAGGIAFSSRTAEVGRDEENMGDESSPGQQQREKAMPDTEPELPVSKLTKRLSQGNLHQRMVEALGKRVENHSPLEQKPLELDLAPPLPGRVRAYMYNATRPPGGRPLGEHKVQLIVPGQRRGERGSFDHGDGRIVLLVGYAAEEDVYIFWDAGLYTGFAWSRNVQVKAETIIEASAGKLATQFRQLRPATGRPALETLLATSPERLAEAIVRRVQLTRDRLIQS